MRRELAEEIATQALGWLCAQDELLPVFLAASGAGVDDLRAALGAQDGPDESVLMAAMDFIVMQDATVLDCARALEQPPETLGLAQAVLAGEGGRHWT
ncbi:MAG: DUF3572 family protein [Rhodobacteraceae bacterium]|nr:DUF3572 family protein [Paracoccaceae bacterium]TVR46151.1 MAG: DUF3572 family protein [Paracoccaceae bacterium]